MQMYIFIVNPHARSGLGHVVWDELESILKKQNIPYKAYFTKYQKHATEIARKATSDDAPSTLVVLGGDGTINEVVNGIQDYEKVILGYIPIGSSNDFARSLNIPSSPKEALELILAAHDTCSINIGRLQYQDRLKHFAVSAGIGFDAAICHEAVISKLKVALNKIHLGKLTYAGIINFLLICRVCQYALNLRTIIVALNIIHLWTLTYACFSPHRLFLTTPQKMTVTLDHKEEFSFPSSYFAAIMNHKYEGGGVKFCPDARPDDNLLDVIVVSDLSKLKILTLLPTAFTGWHTHFKGVHTYQCRHVSIHAERALPVHTDGEPVFLQKSISASCDSKMLQVIVPQRR